MDKKKNTYNKRWASYLKPRQKLHQHETAEHPQTNLSRDQSASQDLRASEDKSSHTEVCGEGEDRHVSMADV